MKSHTSEFKNKIKQFGRELDSKISINNGETILGNSDINSISAHYNGGILKSVMKQLDIDSNVYIPKGTTLRYELGVKVRNNDVLDYRDNYDYINYGTYEVFSIEKQEDNKGYKIVCYDKMLRSMKDYEQMPISYPITICDYLSSICGYLGLDFKNVGETFANYNRVIPSELYLLYDEDTQQYKSLGYTFRDVLDEIAQATASTICINEYDQLEIRYINTTGDTIDEKYLKDINVNFGENYGAINTIILSRSGGTDKIYRTEPPDLPIADRKAIEISDNQIMNRNDRADYLPDLLLKLYNLEYSLNDFSSTGICYYDLCDAYVISIGENTYNCIMFNDEVNITQGIEENIFTEMPEDGETDYTKADKTDRKINQTTLIVDKQNGEIQSLVSETIDTTNPDSLAYKQSQLTQRVDAIESEISEIADLTIQGETIYGSLELDDINESEPIDIKIHPLYENIAYVYPHSNLYPKDINTSGIPLYPKSRILRFYNETTQENIDWELPTDLWYYNGEIYDDLVFSYGDGTNSSIIVNRRCQVNADGTISALATPIVETYPFEHIHLYDGDYTITMLGYPNAYLFVRLMAKNIYTNQFYTKAETNSLISQTATSIDLEVDQKLSLYDKTDDVNAKLSLKLGKDEYGQLISMINASADDITLAGGSKINLTTPGKLVISAGNFKLDSSGNVTATNGTFSGEINATSGTFNGTIINSKIYSNHIQTAKIDNATISLKDLYSTYSYETILKPSYIEYYYNGNREGVVSSSSIFHTGNNYGLNLNSNSGLNTYDSNYDIKSGSLGNNNYGFRLLDKRTNGECRLEHLYGSNVSRLRVLNGYGNGYQFDSENGSSRISDKRDKDNIEKIKQETSIDIIKKINPVSFTYKKEKRVHRGVIAQDVVEALKDNNIKEQIYIYNTDNNHYMLVYEEMIADIINVNKYLLDQVEELKEEIKKLKGDDK